MYMQDVLAKLKDIAEKSDNRDINDAIKGAEMTQTVVAEKQEPTVDEVHEVIAEEEVVNEIPTSNEISDLLRLSGQSGVLGINQPSVIIKEDEVGEGIKVVAKDPNAELDIGAEKKAGPMKTDVGGDWEEFEEFSGNVDLHGGYKPITGKEKSSNPYHQINIEKSRTIPISSIRNLKKKLYYSKSDENWSVVVIFDAEKLCANKAESANSLLKILEEPPERTLFILVTSSINSLIPTIQSRCQKVYFKNLSATDLNDYSIEYLNNNLTLETIEMSLGSISRLIENSDVDKVKTFKKIGADFFSNDMKSIEKLLITFNKIKTIDSNELLNYLNLIKISAKDLYLLNSNANSNTISFSFLSDDYKKILESFPNSNWNGIIELIDDTISNISKNINISLETYSLMINVRSCLQGRRVNRFHQQIGSGI